jgi:hypothetical protein
MADTKKTPKPTVKDLPAKDTTHVKGGRKIWT